MSTTPEALEEARRDPVGSVASLLEGLGDEDTGEQATDNGKDILADGVVEIADVDDPATVDDDADDGEEATAELEGSEEEEASDEDGETSGDAEEEEDGSIELDPALLAAALGIDEGDLSLDDEGRLNIRIKVDGEESAVSLADLRKGFQLDAHNNRKSQQLSEAQREWEEERENLRQEIELRLDFAAELINADASRLQAEFDAVDWDKLETEDPTQYTIKRSKFQDAAAELENRKRNFLSKREEMQQEAAEQAQAKFQERAKEERELLISSVQEWTDKELMKKEGAAMAKYLLEVGFTKEELPYMIDHRALGMVRKAMLYDRVQPKVKSVRKKVKVAPTVKTGAKGTPAKASSKRLAEQKEAARTGDERAKVSFVRNLLSGGNEHGKRQPGRR